MKNCIRKLEKTLRSYAKRCKDVKYTSGVLIAFLLTGLFGSKDVLANHQNTLDLSNDNSSEELIVSQQSIFELGINKNQSVNDNLLVSQATTRSSISDNSIQAQRKAISTSISDIKQNFKQAKKENNRLLKNANLELIQLMEQGDQVVKSPWSSWQFGMNYFYDNWNGIYKGRGDKKEKYPYEGIYQRSGDLFLRNISPDSNMYEKYTALSTENFLYPATTSAITNKRGHYGLEDAYVWQEPVLQIELGAQVRPKEVVKDPITVNAPVITVNPVTPLSTPAAPTPPTPPSIVIKTFSPTAPSVTPPQLPTPPIFNIKLASFCNSMCNVGLNGGRYDPTIGVATIFNSSGTNQNLIIPSNAVNNPSLRYGWTWAGSALFKVYSDYAGTSGGIGILNQDLIIDSINPLDASQRATETSGNRAYNAQNFLVGGSRILTMDNAKDGRVENAGTINLVGPLVVGFEVQTDTLHHGRIVHGVREIKNTGTITDAAEEGYRDTTAGLGGLHVGKTGGQTVASNSVTLNLTPALGGGSIDVTRTPDVVDSAGNTITPGGYTGYKIGLILTFENDDPHATSDYRLINDGTISFKGKSSIGIQIYSPNSNNTHITVQNNGTITMGGIESYGLKLSSRVSNDNMTFTNAGIINISGSNGNSDSLSSGIAILEDSTMTGAASIRAYTSKVTNAGTINVSGGQGNTGMILKVDAADDITNTGNITVRGRSNIGMRVDKGSVATDATGTPQAINNGTITLRGNATNSSGEYSETNNIGMVANGVSIATNNSRIVLENPAKTATGMLATGNGGTVNNSSNGSISGSSLENSIGMSILTGSTGTNAGSINLSGTSVTGLYNDGGTFNMTQGTLNTSGNKAITVYGKGTSTTTNITGGTVSAGNGAVALYADNSTISISNPTVLRANDGGLLFYNYASPNLTNPSGKFNLTGNIQADIENGGTAFYFKGSAADTATFLNNMFNDGQATSTGKLQIKLDDGASLFVLENPGTTAIKLSSANVGSIGGTLGNRVDISRTTSNKYIAYTVYRGSLEIDKDVDIDDATDDYYKMNFTASNVTVNSGIKVTGSTANQNIISQGNYNDATSSSSINITNNGTIDYTGTGSTALAVDFGEITNSTTGVIKMAGDNSTGIYGAANSVLTNDGSIELGTGGVGIWGANELITGKWTGTDANNINITNTGKIIGIDTKSGVFGIYAVNDTTPSAYPNAKSTITHSGDIDLSKNSSSTGILMSNGTLNSSGNISIKDGSVGINANNSTINVTAGTHTIGKESVGFNITGTNSNFNATGGNINITDTGSAVFLLNNVNFTSGTNFNDNFTLTSNNGYTYINIKGSTLNYENTKTVSNDNTIFISAENSNINLGSTASITSTNAEVTGVYSKNGTVVNNGTLSLTGNKSSALYGEDTNITNTSTGSITIGDNGSGMYLKNTVPAVVNNGNNSGSITVGAGSVGMRGESEVILVNTSTGSISSTATGALGMSQSGGSQNIQNAGNITLNGDKSIGMHSEGITTANHRVINTGTITLGNSVDSANPSVGIFSANGTNSMILNDNGGKIIGGTKVVGIYGKNVGLAGTGFGATSELTVGDGAIGVYSDEGIVQIEDGAKISVGNSLGDKQEGVAVYLAGNGQTLDSRTSDITIGDGSFGFVLTGQGNTATTGYFGNTGNISLNKDSIFIYSADKTGNIDNYNHISSTGDENYGIYASGPVKNYGNINFANGVGNVGIYSYVKGATTTPGLIENFGTIDVSASDLSDPDNRKYGIGMAAGFSEEDPIGSGNKVVRGLGNIKNSGTIKVTTGNSIGMYGSGTGTIVHNDGRIELSGTERNIGIFVEEGATAINTGIITTVGTGNKKQIGIAATSGAILDNRGTIHIDAEKGYGLLLAGAIVKNYGDMNITVGSGATPIKEVEAADMTKTMGDTGLDQISINAPAGVANATITLNGVVQTPIIANVQAIPNRRPNDIPTSSVGMYIDTSGINYTRPITNIGALAGLEEADLIIGTEATKYTNSKYIQLSDEMIEPYNDMIRTSGIETWSIYSGSLTWMASITQLPDFTIRNAYLAKIPYTVYASDKDTTRDTYNFLDGLEQRYGVDWYGDRGAKEKELFDKLNDIGNNERVLLLQAFDEMMGHQYANVQQRTVEISNKLDKEFRHLSDEWSNPSKQNNKIKVFGMKGKYKTDTAGIIDYDSNSYGVAYVHEDETIKLGNSTGWYTGYVFNQNDFKDIGKSKEKTNMIKAGLFKSKAFDHNGSLKWTISGGGYVAQNDMARRFLVVDEIFKANSTYYSYGANVKNEISKEFRTSERTKLKAYGSLDLGYGKFSSIKEDKGEVRLEVKSNDYYSIKPEIGAMFRFDQPFAQKATFTASLGLGYETELGEVNNTKNKAKVRFTTADYFNLRGEKENRKGNAKADLKLGIDNQRFGVTLNAGYDTNGENFRAGIGLRGIF